MCFSFRRSAWERKVRRSAAREEIVETRPNSAGNTPETRETAVAPDRLAPDPLPANRPPCIELLDEAIVAILRRKTPVERGAMIFDANRTMRLRLEAHLRSHHPDWTDQAIAQEIARRMSLGTS
jgi:hypothetical protein